MADKYGLHHETVTIDRLGEVRLREWTYAESFEYDRINAEARGKDDKLGEFHALCRSLIPAVVEPPELIEALKTGDMHPVAAHELVREVFRVNKIDAPALEGEVGEDESYVTHAEDAAEDFRNAQTSASGSV